MTPAEFNDVVVLPTIREYLNARGDRRLAYLACIAAYSLVDHIISAVTVREKGNEHVRNPISSLCPRSYAVIRGICNATKHVTPDNGQYLGRIGSETHVNEAHGAGRFGTGMGRGKEGLLVEIDGRHLFVDGCIQQFMISVSDVFGNLGINMPPEMIDSHFQPAGIAAGASLTDHYR